ncbi:hypothetical protein K504DRAFT_450185 [Pleomassaria siparia CBS 279.74]|uniref:Uncharacterized protein n=1 Tax=Pleomassaria siparia CBS 279.74 TaxID=1314801 RepID=A0A6G1KKX8_9PLEO|nr:hypothetical protein K504DRAFT_450185 [Pleomassaria siparia CBS 279.74]
MQWLEDFLVTKTKQSDNTKVALCLYSAGVHAKYAFRNNALMIYLTSSVRFSAPYYTLEINFLRHIVQENSSLVFEISETTVPGAKSSSYCSTAKHKTPELAYTAKLSFQAPFYPCHKPSTTATSIRYVNSSSPKNMSKHTMPYTTQTWETIAFLPTALLLRSAIPMLTPTTPSKPLTSLVLSLSLASNIHRSLQLTRKIEQLEAQVAQRQTMELVVELAGLRVKKEAFCRAVETELDDVWTRAGFLPGNRPSQTQVTVPIHRGLDSSTKRPLPSPNSPTHGRKNSRTGRAVTEHDLDSGPEDDEVMADGDGNENGDGDGDGECTSDECLQPLGIPTTAIPLDNGEKNRLGTWNWGDAVRGRNPGNKTIRGEAAVSPITACFV